MRWFGKTWGAPVCDPATWTETPVGAGCLFCPISIMPNDKGFLLPSGSLEHNKVAVEIGARHVTYAVHLDCMLHQVLGRDAGEDTLEMVPT